MLYTLSVRRRVYVLGLTLAAALSGACQKKPAPLPDVDRPAELLGGPTVGGPPVDVAGLFGKVVVVNFWSPG
jgi:hypothetical protein